MEGSSSLLSNVPVRHCGGIVVERRNRVNGLPRIAPLPIPLTIELATGAHFERYVPGAGTMTIIRWPGKRYLHAAFVCSGRDV